MKKHCVILLLAVALAYSAQAAELTQQEACSKFSGAIVSIDAGGAGLGSGFIVSADGIILTANHVVRNEAGEFFSAIDVQLPGGDHVLARPLIPLSLENVGQDYAFLKVEYKSPLPFLKLGSVGEVVVGADATIIGFPFSAITDQGKRISKKFCLVATFAMSGNETVSETVSQRTTKGIVNVSEDVKVDIIYFQGPSVKGLSGSPIIARDTGNVVGIVSTKLSGIGPALSTLKDETAKGLGGGVVISGLAPGPVIHEIVTVMDEQLANGLGSAVGIDNPALALRKSQNKRR